MPKGWQEWSYSMIELDITLLIPVCQATLGTYRACPNLLLLNGNLHTP